jgi:hypothetical protein
MDTPRRPSQAEHIGSRSRCSKGRRINNFDVDVRVNSVGYIPLAQTFRSWIRNRTPDECNATAKRLRSYRTYATNRTYMSPDSRLRFCRSSCRPRSVNWSARLEATRRTHCCSTKQSNTPRPRAPAKWFRRSLQSRQGRARISPLRWTLGRSMPRLVKPDSPFEVRW